MYDKNLSGQPRNKLQEINGKPSGDLTVLSVKRI